MFADRNGKIWRRNRETEYVGDTFGQVHKYFLKKKCYVHIRTKQWRIQGKGYKQYLRLFRSAIYLF